MPTPTTTQPQADFDMQMLELTLKKRVGHVIQDLQFKWIDRRGVILSGRARHYYAKQTAQKIVMQETDITILANDIQVS